MRKLFFLYIKRLFKVIKTFWKEYKKTEPHTRRPFKLLVITDFSLYKKASELFFK